MAGQRAVDLALDLMRMPTLAPILVSQPFPSDLPDLIRIASRNVDVSSAAAAASGVSERMLLSAATFYLREMLFAPGADSYRNLGVERGASKAQMRLHMRLLLQWLHPDHNPDPTANLLAERVIGAWREAGEGKGAVSKPIEKLHASRLLVANASLQRHPRGVRVSWIGIPLEQPSAKRKTKRRRSYRAIALAVGVAEAIALICIPDSVLSSRLHRSLTRIPAHSAIKDAEARSRLVHVDVKQAP